MLVLLENTTFSLHKVIRNAGIIRIAGIIRGRVLYEEILYSFYVKSIATNAPQSQKLTL